MVFVNKTCLKISKFFTWMLVVIFNTLHTVSYMDQFSVQIHKVPYNIFKKRIIMNKISEYMHLSRNLFIKYTKKKFNILKIYKTKS